MDHISFRYYIPGIIFLIPTYLVVIWEAISFHKIIDPDIKTFVLVGSITTFPAIALPIGWWVYNIYRVWWIIWTRGGYEKKDFIKIIRKDFKPFFSPHAESVLIDLSHINGIKKWAKFDLQTFWKTFYPFTSFIKFHRLIKQKDINPQFTESISDSILMKDATYEYARSISSVRYGLESGGFALLLGSLYGLGFYFLLHSSLARNTNSFDDSTATDQFCSLYFGIAFLTILTIFAVVSLYKRWCFADSEYDARLLFSTITSVSSNLLEPEFFSKKLPAKLVAEIEKLDLSGNPYAAFDLDNTLLTGDIGDAVFASLLKNKLILDFSWSDYEKLLADDREQAYKKVINAMQGLNVKDVKNITHQTLSNRDAFIELNDKQVPVPQAYPVMQALISFLKMKNIAVYVVTASNKISADIACWELFGIPATHVFGAGVSVNKAGKIVTDSNPIPYGPEKAAILKKAFDKKQPLITGGDALSDKELLEYTQSAGIRLWLGHDLDVFNDLKTNSFRGLKFYLIKKAKA